MQVPVVSMSDGSGDEEPTHVDVVEDPVEASDTESLGRDSDVASIVFSEVSTESVEEPAIRQVANARGISRGLAQLDGFHLSEIFERRAHVMRVVPHVMRAAFCSAIRVACEEISSGFSLGDITRQERGWKLFLLLPRMLLCRPRRGGFVPRKDLEQRLALFHGGNWHELVSHSIRMAEQVSQNLVRRGRHHNSDTVEARAVRAEKFVQLGEISAGCQALESARVAPGTLATLHALTNQQRRPPVPREPVPEGLATAMPESPFDLDFDRFISNIRRAKRGAAPGPSGMTIEHLHPLLENDACFVLQGSGAAQRTGRFEAWTHYRFGKAGWWGSRNRGW